MYPTDVTNTQWQIINIFLDIPNRKRKNSLRTVWNRIMCLVKTSCQCRILPLEN